MIYTTAERNNAVLLIEAGKADFNKVDLYERLAEFNWITIKRTSGVPSAVELTYAGKDLCRKLLKNK